MERVIHWFLSERVIALPLQNQHTYTRGLGRETVLSTFADLVESAFHRGKKSLVVSLDCSGPGFRLIKFSSAEEALCQSGSPAAITGWYNLVRGHQCDQMVRSKNRNRVDNFWAYLLEHCIFINKFFLKIYKFCGFCARLVTL